MINRFFILILFFASFATAQPGYYAAIEFKVFKDGNLVDFKNQDWKVKPSKEIWDNATQGETSPGYYKIEVHGGSGQEIFYLDISCKNDTMRIYPPSVGFRTVRLDSIPFRKGAFKIPTYLYDTQDFIKKMATGFETLPSLKSNWDLFSVTREAYKCYLEKVEDLDQISYPTLSADQVNALSWTSSIRFLFKKNFIVKEFDGYDQQLQPVKKRFLYEIKNLTDTTFWGGKIQGYEILSMYGKEKIFYALIKKTYADFNNAPSYGIYKLHFVNEEKMPTELSAILKKQQIDEDYRFAMKTQGYKGALRIKIQNQYNKIVH